MRQTPSCEATSNCFVSAIGRSNLTICSRLGVSTSKSELSDVPTSEVTLTACVGRSTRYAAATARRPSVTKAIVLADSDIGSSEKHYLSCELRVGHAPGMKRRGLRMLFTSVGRGRRLGVPFRGGG